MAAVGAPIACVAAMLSSGVALAQGVSASATYDISHTVATNVEG